VSFISVWQTHKSASIHSFIHSLKFCWFVIV